MIGKKLAQAAQKEAVLGRPFPQNAEVEIQSGKIEIRAQAKIVDTDRFSKLAEKVTVSVGGAASKASVEEKAQKFCERATYLPEALQFVETDAGGSAIVRSTPETMAGAGEPYFEAKVKPSEITLERFQPKRGGGRDRVPFVLTDDLLARVADDAASVLTPKK